MAKPQTSTANRQTSAVKHPQIRTYNQPYSVDYGHIANYLCRLLLLGETGSGKTSFLNLLFNYACIIQKSGGNYKLADLQNFNEAALQTQSKTSGAKPYDLLLHDGFTLGIIDTPGFGDIRGIDKDDEHVRLIVETLDQVKYIHCVCLVINGRLGNVSPSLMYVLDRITTVLPKNVLGNHIVVSTNTQDFDDINLPLDALPKCFTERKDDRWFAVENPYCKLEKARKRGPLNEDTASRIKASFEKTGRVLDNMLGIIKDFQPVHTSKFQILYSTTQEIEEVVMKLLIAYDDQEKIEANIRKAEEDIKEALRRKELNKNFKLKGRSYVHDKLVHTEHHNTLCNVSNCYENCHLNCKLPMTVADPEVFKDCYCVTKGGGSCCSVCTHPYYFHRHHYLKHEPERRTQHFIFNEAMKKEFDNAKSMEDRARILRDDLAHKKKQCEDEK